MGEGEDAGQVCEGVFANVGRGVCAFGPVIALSRNAMCTLASVADRNMCRNTHVNTRPILTVSGTEIKNKFMGLVQ